MKNLLRLNCKLALLLFAAASAGNVKGLTPAEWKYRQSIDVDTLGAVKVALPLESIDQLQSDFRDLRLVAPSGAEVPFALVRPRPALARTIPVALRTELGEQSTVLSFPTNTGEPLEFVELAVNGAEFLKPVRVEISADGQTWEKLAEGSPLFRQSGVTQSKLSLGGRRAAFVRLTLSDQRSAPIVVTQAILITTVPASIPAEPLAVRLAHREEFAGETVATLDLGAAHLDLATLTLEAEDGLFQRHLTVAVRELVDGKISERVVAEGTLYRVSLEGLPSAERLDLAIEKELPAREVILHIENGDSPPLRFAHLSARHRPVYAAFAASEKGAYTFLSGNAHALAPHYDLAGLTTTLSELKPKALRAGLIATSPDYHDTDPLAGLAFEGAALETALWKRQRAVTFSAPGVLELELDLPTLSAAQPDLSDLRLVREGKQVPYILERTHLARAYLLALESANDAKRPALSRWKLPLGHAHLPLTRVVFTSTTLLFDRHFRLYEILGSDAAGRSEHLLAETTWMHRPGETTTPLSLNLVTRPETETLWLETENGDNPAIALENAQAYYPVTRLLFKASSPAESLSLLYGNREATAPRYDLGLVAPQLVAAERQMASLAQDESRSENSSSLTGLFDGGLANMALWLVLALVVVLLLVIVAKLLPKPPGGA